MCEGGHMCVRVGERVKESAIQGIVKEWYKIWYQHRFDSIYI